MDKLEPTIKAHVPFHPPQMPEQEAAIHAARVAERKHQFNSARRAFVEVCAELCHGVNKAYCESLGDMSHPLWADAPQWQKESARLGVELHMSGDHSPSASHESWLEQKKREGWNYGAVNNPGRKEHPCFVPFGMLPKEQQAKAYQVAQDNAGKRAD